MERERQRETERDRERQRETERDREKQSETERQRETERDRERQRETEAETEREAGGVGQEGGGDGDRARQRDRARQSETERDRARQSETERDRARQSDRGQTAEDGEKDIVLFASSTLIHGHLQHSVPHTRMTHADVCSWLTMMTYIVCRRQVRDCEKKGKKKVTPQLQCHCTRCQKLYIHKCEIIKIIREKCIPRQSPIEFLKRRKKLLFVSFSFSLSRFLENSQKYLCLSNEKNWQIEKLTESTHSFFLQQKKRNITQTHDCKYSKKQKQKQKKKKKIGKKIVCVVFLSVFFFFFFFFSFSLSLFLYFSHI
jgi:hypothetical protein